MGTIEIVLIKYFMQFFRMITNELAAPSSLVAFVAAKSTLISLVSGSTERGKDDGTEEGKEEKRKSSRNFPLHLAGKIFPPLIPSPSLSPSRSQREGRLCPNSLHFRFSSLLVPILHCRPGADSEGERASGMGSALT